MGLIRGKEVLGRYEKGTAKLGCAQRDSQEQNCGTLYHANLNLEKSTKIITKK
jgi:hypothetical protein